MKKLFTTLLVAVAVFMGVSTLSALAGGGGCVTPPNGWSGPGSTPPNGNVCPPINTGTSWQSKDGALGVGVGVTHQSGTVFDVLGGAVIDTLATINLGTNNLTVKGGSQQLGTNKVLADVNGTGVATWQPLSALTTPGGSNAISAVYGPLADTSAGNTNLMTRTVSFTLTGQHNVMIMAYARVQVDTHDSTGSVDLVRDGSIQIDTVRLASVSTNDSGGVNSYFPTLIYGGSLAGGPHTLTVTVHPQAGSWTSLLRNGNSVGTTAPANDVQFVVYVF